LNPQEAALIERLKAGEEAAFQTLFRDYYPLLCVYAKRLTGDADGAREVVQDLFVRLYEGRQTLPAPGSLKSYLYAAVRYACLNQLKQAYTRHQHHQQILYHAPTGEDTDALVQLELEEKIWRAVQDLPKQCRKIFRMNRFEDKKNRQIADELGISVRTIETQISKALRLLRGALSDFLPLLLLLAAAPGAKKVERLWVNG
jgi:RNA polymerase sigma-70 factor (ECF subfamily)